MKKLMLLSVALFLFLQLGTYAQEISDGTAWGVKGRMWII